MPSSARGRGLPYFPRARIFKFASINIHRLNKTPLNIIHWNCRGIRNKLSEIPGIANNIQILCLQETLITSPSHLRINGFNQNNLYFSLPNIRGLSTLIHCDYGYASLDCSAFFHTSVEIIGIQVDCSLDEPLFIFNIYRHPNVNTPLHFYSKLFAFASTHKYVLFVGDFNAHHPDWEDHHTDSQRERISQESEACHLVIMNDGQPTFLSSPNFSSSVIDLFIASKPLAPLINQETYQDLYGSDTNPVRISICNTHPSTYRFSFKYHLSPSQLSFIQGRLVLRAPSLRDELFSQASLSPVQKYECFCTALNEVVSLVFDSKKYLPLKKRVTEPEFQLLGGMIDALGQLNFVARCAEFTRPTHLGIIGLLTSVVMHNAKRF